MTSLGLAAVLQVSILAGGTDSYAEAHRLTADTGKPMVVMVSAEWCGACQVMKREVVPQIKEKGLLKKVSFAIVDLDKQRKLGQTLTHGGPIPQLLMYRKAPDGWRLSRLIGRQSTSDVVSFIDRGLKRDETVNAKIAGQHKNDKPVEPASYTLTKD